MTADKVMQSLMIAWRRTSTAAVVSRSLEATSNLYAECTPARMNEDLGLLNCKFEELARFGSFTD